MAAIVRIFTGYSGAVRGAIWMILGGLSLLMLAVSIRFLQHRIHVLEMIFLRSVISFLLILPWVLKQKRSDLATRRLPLHIFRNGVHYLGNIGWFLGVTLVSLADVQALQFTEPLFAIVLAAVFLREKIGAHRWTATVLGFVGALIIIRPGVVEISLGTLCVLIGAAFYASSKIATKALAHTDSPNTILFYMTVVFIPVSAVPALFVWTTPAWEDILPVFLLGAFGVAAHACIIRAFAAADASFVIPFDFLRLPFAAIFGFLLYGEQPEIWVWLGAALIFGATYYLTLRETRARGRKATP